MSLRDVVFATTDASRAVSRARRYIDAFLFLT